MKRLSDHLRRALHALAALHTSAGSFVYRGVRFWHLGLRLDQIQAAEVVDAVVADLVKHGHRIEAVEALLPRVTVRVTAARPLLNGLPVEQFGRWRGGLRDRGDVRLVFDADWLARLGAVLRALLVAELEPDRVRAPAGRVF